MAAKKLINYIYKWDIDDFLWHVALFKYAQPSSQNTTGTVGKYCHFQKCIKQGGGGTMQKMDNYSRYQSMHPRKKTLHIYNMLNGYGDMGIHIFSILNMIDKIRLI